MPLSHLSDRGVLRVTGEDARHFLHNLVTNDIESLGRGEARFAALLTPQGKIIADFFVIASHHTDDDFWIDCPKALAPDLAKRFGFYKLRATVAIADLSETHAILACWDGANPETENGVAFTDPRFAPLGSRLIVDQALASSLASHPASLWQTHRIMLGIPEGGKDFTYSDAFPHEADMDLLNGVDFKKGCYVGQEIVSRTHHRGTARTRSVLVQFPAGVSAPEGVEIHAGTKTVGTLGSSAPEGHAIALLRLDRVQEAMAAGEPLSAGGLPLRILRPEWMPQAILDGASHA